ncbi:hypothetical protein L2E82_21244 [Cichorium intybus]|uniref:Uncharacterized protein n=1 Tax=Cichorium intybus TaxID=13427 RepID=A0ACB9DV59_CICIN|nr:hypothetical protein L2E82_21244 [Cichorium intybus]
MNSQCRKVLRDEESSKKKRKNPGNSGADVRGTRKAQQQQSRFRALREEELQGPPSRTRASLKRRLHEPSSSKKLKVEKKLNQEDVSRNGKTHVDIEPEDVHAPNTEDPLGAPSINQSLPDKQTLEHVIDTLQRKDVYEIFAEPVDPEEVEDYYEIIEEPMDFGTMRAKLHEGMYASLQQFEHDVFLITGNAMHFNSSGTVFFRQAHAIHKLAKRVFHVLKTNPENFESEFSGTRRRSCRRSLDESFLKTSETTRGSRDAKRCDSIEADRRSTYKPQLDLNNDKPSKSLIYLNQPEHGYRKSLMQFVKDLGPTAQMVAKRKLQMLGDASISDHQTKRQDSRIQFGQTKNLILFGCRHPVLNDDKQDSPVTGITKIGSIATQNRIMTRDQDSSFLTSQFLRTTSNGTDRDESSRSSGYMDSDVTSTRGLFTRVLMPHAALDLGFLKSKMHGDDEWRRRI